MTTATGVAQYSAQVFERNASSLVAMALVVCEYAANLEDEVHYIWRRPMNRVKGIYLISRYLGLGGLITNSFLLFVGPLASVPSKVEHCQAWFSFYVVISSLILFSIDAIAMLRVYVLYNRNAKVGALFASLIVTEATLVTTCSSTIIRIIPFSPICDVEKTPLQVIYFICSVLITQLSLLFFTFHKRRLLAGQLHIPLLRLVFREGTWISSFVCCICLFPVSYSLITGTSKPHLILLWPIALLSTAACRVILNLHRLPTEGRSMRTSSIPGTDTDIQFTSLFTMGELEDSTAGLTRRYSIAHIDNRHSLPATASLSSLSLNGSASSIASSFTPDGLLLRVDCTIPADVATNND